MKIGRFGLYLHLVWQGWWIGPYTGEPPDDEPYAWDKAWCLYIPGVIFDLVRYRA